MSDANSSPENISLRERFFNNIVGRILSGELRPGDRLPPERELALEAGISRSSVNLGILELESKGFLRVEPRQGAFVAEYRRHGTPQTLSVIMSYDSARLDYSLLGDLLDFRILIECDAARRACANLTAEDATTLDTFLSLIASSRGGQLVRALLDFHEYVTQLSGNDVYSMIYKSFDGPLRSLTEAHFRVPGELELSLPLYSELVEALKARDGDRAERAMRAVLETASDFLKQQSLSAGKP
jgi:GntR family transcriptional repressor for pyruvate dehydrogenase complex